MLEQSYAITGRLVGSGVEFGSPEKYTKYTFHGFAFDIVRRMETPQNAYVAIKITGDTIPVDVVRELVTLLFDRGVLCDERQ